jgi:hypothetical protein
MPGASEATIPLIFEEGPFIGQPYTAGAVKIRLVAFSAATAYAPLTVNSAVGFGAGAGAPNLPGGVAVLDALNPTLTLQAPNALAQPGRFGNGLEDLWGIARVAGIFDGHQGYRLFSPGVAGTEITIMFYGGQDFYVQQTGASEQTIDGAGLRADWYIENIAPGFTPFDPSGGPSTPARGAATYPTVTDGTPALSTVTIPNFLHPDGVLGGAAAEYEVVVGPNGSRVGRGNFSVVPGSGPCAAQFAVGMTWLFEDNTFGAPPFGWSAKGNDSDPIYGAVVPEPGVMALALAGMLVIGGSVRKRERVTSDA